MAVSNVPYSQSKRVRIPQYGPTDRIHRRYWIPSECKIQRVAWIPIKSQIQGKMKLQIQGERDRGKPGGLVYRATSLIRNNAPLGPYSRTMSGLYGEGAIACGEYGACAMSNQIVIYSIRVMAKECIRQRCLSALLLCYSRA